MAKVGYYPGCSLEGTAKDFGHSAEVCAKLMGVELKEVTDWNCCGASSAHCLNHKLSIALPARTLALAQKDEVEEVFAPCSMCYANLKRVNREFEDDAAKKEYCKIMEKEYDGKIKPLNMFELVQKYGVTKLKDAPQRLKGMKVAAYYGCLLVRPPDVADVDRFEDPNVIEEIIKMTGAEPVEWHHKTECCGGGLALSRTDGVVELVGRIVDDALENEADVILAACPMCHANLDMRQEAAGKQNKKKYDVPILYLSEFVSLALGASMNDLMIHTHITNATKYLKGFFRGAQGQGE
jgi:heterodisulfide reductase subunit B